MAILSEYGSIELDLTRTQAEAIQRTGYMEVTPASADRWRVTAKSHVGSLVVGDVELLVRPKINPENLFLLLEPGLPPNAWRKEAFDYEVTSDLLPSIITFFARTVETTLARGLLRSYRVCRDSLITLRGRLDAVGQFNRAGVLTPVACTYDDFSEDILENQVLRTAVRLALRVPGVALLERQRLMRQLVALHGVSDIAVRAETLDSVRVTRLNQHYAPALGLARLVLTNLTLTDVRGSTTALSFMVDMDDLFQRFVTERLRRELQGRLDLIGEPTVHLGQGQQVAMQPDLVFRAPRGVIRYVGDIKYKLAPDARGRSSDYYQLLAYTTAMDLTEGVLIYCSDSGDTHQSVVTVKHSGKRLVLHSIDLSGTPAQVEHEIATLADAIAASSIGGGTSYVAGDPMAP